ncbi:hypothetical protein Bca4012_020750 [Brassica carinata]
MSSTRKAWTVAVSIGVVKTLKHQLGLCRWNYMFRLVNQHLQNNVRTVSQGNRFSSSVSAVVNLSGESEKAKKCEESLITVMYLSCWDPN